MPAGAPAREVCNSEHETIPQAAANSISTAKRRENNATFTPIALKYRLVVTHSVSYGYVRFKYLIQQGANRPNPRHDSLASTCPYTVRPTLPPLKPRPARPPRISSPSLRNAANGPARA